MRVRPRLEQRAHRRARGEAVAVAGARLRARVDAGHHAPRSPLTPCWRRSPPKRTSTSSAASSRARSCCCRIARAVAPLFEAPARRLTDQNLDEMQSQPVAPPQAAAAGGGQAADRQFTAKRNAFLLAEGAVAVLEPANGRGDSGSLLVGGGGSRNPKDPPVPPQLAVATEHYNRIARLLEHGQTVTLELDVRNTFHDADLNMFNIVAEIPGTDKADEVVMLGAHFDSWHTGTGSVDNAVGVGGDARGDAHPQAVRRPAAPHGAHGPVDRRRAGTDRLADVRPQPLRRSRRHEAQAGTRQARRLLQHGQRHRPVSRRLPAGERSRRADLPRLDGAVREPRDDAPDDSQHRRHRSPVRSTTSDCRDSSSFRIPVQYSSRTHHSNLDVYDQLIASDLMKNAVITAAFVYHTANREQMLPRKPLPRPTRRRGRHPSSEGASTATSGQGTMSSDRPTWHAPPRLALSHR